MSKFTKFLLKDISTSQTGPFGSQLHKEDYVNNGTPIVTVEHLGEISFSLNNLPMVSDLDKIRLSKYTLKENDIVFSRVGSIDKCTLVSKKEEGWLFSGRCIRVRFNEKADPKYISFYFRQSNFKKMMLNISVGAVMPSLNTSLMGNLPLFLPSKTIQQKIASVLSSLDAKIELNNRINAELEAMAKTLYDYWFVQFDFPDTNGKPYKSSGGAMEYNAELKREIPKGWEVKELSSLIHIERGISYKSEEIASTGTPMVNLNSFYLDGKYKTEGIKYFNGKYSDSKVVKSGDLIIATTDVTRNADIIGKANLIPNIYEEDIVLSCDIAKIIPDERLDKFYLEKLFNSTSYHNYIKGFASGTLVLHLNMNGIGWYKTFIPPKNLLNKHANLVNPIQMKKDLIIKQNIQLAELRDWLLPMLMNGQIKVL